MSASTSAARWYWRRSPFFVVGVALYVLFMWWVMTRQMTWDAPQRAMCDKQVNVLLTTHDAVDLMRANILIGRLNCSVWRRIPAPD